MRHETTNLVTHMELVVLTMNKTNVVIIPLFIGPALGNIAGPPRIYIYFTDPLYGTSNPKAAL